MTDTRDDFESRFKLCIRQKERRKTGDYWDSDIQRLWAGWQARGELLEGAEQSADIARVVFANMQSIEKHVTDLREQLRGERQRWEKAITDAEASALHVYSDSCNHTRDAVHYMAQVLLADLK